MSNISTALVHDWLMGIGGGERTLQCIYDVFPAPIYALIKDANKLDATFFAEKDIRTSFIQNLPFSKKFYRHFLPLYPLAIEQLDLKDYELVLSTSHAVAKGVLTHSRQLHISYCFTPMRYAWDLYHNYLENLDGFQKKIARFFLHYLRNWDISSLNRVDHFVAISNYIKKRIRKIYGRDSTVIYPPVATHIFRSASQKEGFYLTLSRMVPYKKMDLIVEAFAQTPHRKLVVIGDGPEMHRVKQKAKKNIEIIGNQKDAAVQEYLGKAKAFVFAAEEDFGICVVEAQAAGTPVIAFGRGGSLETIEEGKTGLFFQKQSVDSLLGALNEFEKKEALFDPAQIKQHAEKFSEVRFKQEFKAFVDQKWVEFHESNHSCRR